jgi:hypothetical protein
LGGQAVPQLKTCPLCGKKDPLEKTFTCQSCKCDYLCERHQAPDTFLCKECEQKRKEQAGNLVKKSPRQCEEVEDISIENPEDGVRVPFATPQPVVSLSKKPVPAEMTTRLVVVFQQTWH